MKPVSLVAAIVFDIIAVLHLLRIVLHIEAIVGGWAVPMWMSGVACVAAAVLSGLLFREARSKSS